PALSDRARGRVEAEGNLLHPRRSLSGRRAQARAARARHGGDAGGHRRTQRRAARQGEVEHAGSPRARRRALRTDGRGHEDRGLGRRARHPPAGALWPAIADPARRAAAASRVSHRPGAEHRRRQAEEPGEVGHRRIGNEEEETMIRTLAVFLLCSASAQAQTEIQWWHSMTGANNTGVNELAAKFNASQKEYKVVPVFKGSYPESMTAAIAAFRAGN